MNNYKTLTVSEISDEKLVSIIGDLFTAQSWNLPSCEVLVNGQKTTCPTENIEYYRSELDRRKRETLTIYVNGEWDKSLDHSESILILDKGL